MSKSYISVIKHFEAAPANVQKYFPNLAELVKSYPWEVPISYAFSRIELAKRMTIYCGIVKLHWCESTVTWRLVSEDYMERGRFKDLFRIVYGHQIPVDLIAKLERGEKIRDKIAHGKRWETKEAREGLTSVIDFATEFNDFLYEHAGFRPFGDLRGFKGRKQSLAAATTHWVLRGMGIPKKSES